MKDQVIIPTSSITLIPSGKNEKSITMGKSGSIKKKENDPIILLPPVEEKYIKARDYDFL